MGQKWSLLQPMAAFQQSLPHQSQLRLVSGFECQLEIADTPMQQLGAA